MNNIITIELSWQGIPITVSANTDWLGGDMVHLEFRAPEPLPITSTGYRSHFMPRLIWDEIDDLTEHILAWLDEKSQSKEWKAHWEARKQPSLF